MATGDILTIAASPGTVTITLASLADGAARQSTQITDASPSIPEYTVAAKITTGTSPTAGGRLEVYLARSDDGSPEIRDGGTGTSDAAYSGTKDELELLRIVRVDGTSDQAYQFSMIVRNPGTDFVIVVVNETGVALNSTGGNHAVREVAQNQQVLT